MRPRFFIAASLATVIAAGVLWLPRSATDGPGLQQASLQNVFPTRRDAGYVSSAACVECHRDQHTSWHQSYHRTMTQPATPQTVVASFDDVHLETAGQTAHLQQRGNEFWVNLVDPSWERDTFAIWAQRRNTDAPDPFDTAESPPRIDAQVVMTTGSHHFQAYWIQGNQGREMWQFPWRYHIETKRWVHRKDVFLAPPEWRPGMWFRTWNAQCIYCHSTGPLPGQNPENGVLENTEIVEFGIACEACHGPCEQHVAFHDDDSAVAQDLPADPIVNPAKLDNKPSAQVCGSCHAHFQHTDSNLAVDGPKYRPGDNLFHFGLLELPENEQGVMSRFWGDGTNRSGGREFSGLSSSECFLQGELACTTCHSMHASDPNDQLKAEALTGDVCLTCHDTFADDVAVSRHTHHAAASSGSNCYNCHMPHTNYALFKAIRSHTIDSPKVGPLLSNARPNACNLCHLDQTLEWTAEHLESWYGIEHPLMGADDSTVAAGILWALKGDAGQRVIAAWHFGWAPARAASGTNWMLPTLAKLMNDPYAAVRWVANASLRKDPSFADAEFDFDVPKEARSKAIRRILESEGDVGIAVGDVAARKRLLLRDDGSPDEQRARELLQRRDQRMVAGVE